MLCDSWRSSCGVMLQRCVRALALGGMLVLRMPAITQVVRGARVWLRSWQQRADCEPSCGVSAVLPLVASCTLMCATVLGASG